MGILACCICKHYLYNGPNELFGTWNMPENPNVISVTGLNKIYQSGHQALTDINLEIRKGEIFGRSSGQANTGGMQGNQHVIEVVVAAGDIPLLIGQRVTVRFLKEGKDDSS